MFRVTLRVGSLGSTGRSLHGDGARRMALPSPGRCAINSASSIPTCPMCRKLRPFANGLANEPNRLVSAHSRSVPVRAGCAMGGRSGSNLRTHQFDPLLPFKIGPGTGVEHQKAGVGATGRMQNERSFRKRPANASVRPKRAFWVHAVSRQALVQGSAFTVSLVNSPKPAALRSSTGMSWKTYRTPDAYNRCEETLVRRRPPSPARSRSGSR